MATWINQRGIFRPWRVWATFATEERAKLGMIRLGKTYERLTGFKMVIKAPGEPRVHEGEGR